jgi:hypothetical protein
MREIKTYCKGAPFYNAFIGCQVLGLNQKHHLLMVLAIFGRSH